MSNDDQNDRKSQRAVRSRSAVRKRQAVLAEFAGAADASVAGSCFDKLSMNGNFLNLSNICSVRPEPFDFAQDRLVEGQTRHPITSSRATILRQNPSDLSPRTSHC